VEDEDNDNDWGGFHTGGRCVFLPVTTELAGDPEVDSAEGFLADVRGPQLGERLSHRADGVFHCTISDGSMEGSLTAAAISLGEDLNGRDWVRTVFEEWVNVVREAKLFPAAPMRIHRSGAFSSDAKAVLLLDKAEISAESVSFSKVAHAPLNCLRKRGIKMGQKLGISEMKWARALIFQNIGDTRDEVAKWEVAVVTLMKGMETEEIHNGARG
jgi:hypothetical protein